MQFRAMKNISLLKGNECLQKAFGKDLLSKIKAAFENARSEKKMFAGIHNIYIFNGSSIS